MEPLAALQSTLPAATPTARAAADRDDRDSAAARAPEKSRAVELQPTRIEGTEATGQAISRKVDEERAPQVVAPGSTKLQSSDQELTEEESKLATQDLQKRLQEEGDRARTAIQQLAPEVRPSNRSVQYTVADDINTVQSKVIDRETHEVVREIPSDQQIAMIRSYQKLIGQNLDVRA